jgi:hypothetical protein
VALLEEKRKSAQKESLVDFGHFASGVNLEEIRGLARAGVTGYREQRAEGQVVGKNHGW